MQVQAFYNAPDLVVQSKPANVRDGFREESKMGAAPKKQTSALERLVCLVLSSRVFLCLYVGPIAMDHLQTSVHVELRNLRPASVTGIHKEHPFANQLE